MMLKPNWLVVTGVALGLVAVLAMRVHIERAEESVKVLRLVANKSIARGERLQPDDVAATKLPATFADLTQLVVEDSVTGREWVMSREATRDIPAGALLLHEYFDDAPEARFPATIETGMRAMAVPVDAVSAVAYFVEPGALVDVIGTFDREDAVAEARPPTGGEAAPDVMAASGRVTETRTVLQKIKVLAVGAASTRQRYRSLAERGFDTVTLEVSPEQAEFLTFALAHARGGLTLVLRHPADLATVEPRAVNWRTMSGP